MPLIGLSNDVMLDSGNLHFALDPHNVIYTGGTADYVVPQNCYAIIHIGGSNFNTYTLQISYDGSSWVEVLGNFKRGDGGLAPDYSGPIFLRKGCHIRTNQGYSSNCTCRLFGLR